MLRLPVTEREEAERLYPDAQLVRGHMLCGIKNYEKGRAWQ